MIKFSNNQESNLSLLNDLSTEEALYNIYLGRIDRTYIGETNNLKRRLYQHFLEGSNIIELNEEFINHPSSITVTYILLPESSKMDRLLLELAEKNKYDFSHLLNRDPGLEDYSTRKEVYQLTMDGDFLASYHSIKEAERKLGFNPGAISTACRFDKAYYGYVWMFKDQYSPESAKEKSSKTFNGDEARRILIHAFLEDGEYIASFNGCLQAEALTGINSGNITSCLKGNRKSAGAVNGQKLIWLYDSHLKAKPKINLEKEGSILQIDPRTKEVVDRFSSLIEAANSTGIHVGNIGQAVNKSRKTAGAFYWVKDETNKTNQR